MSQRASPASWARGVCGCDSEVYRGEGGGGGLSGESCTLLFYSLDFSSQYFQAEIKILILQ